MILRFKSRGPEVKQFQERLAGQGFNLGKYGADGGFGDDTENAVKEFQKQNNLGDDGVVGNKTWSTLFHHLSKHFTFPELTVSTTAAKRGIVNAPNGQETKNLLFTAEQMEKVRSILGNHPIIVTSCFRSEKVNSLVGGSRTSAHRYGLAVDFTCPKFGNTRKICEAIIAAQNKGLIEFDQLILEFPPSGWVHIGFKQDGKDQRKQVLTAKKVNGSTKYLNGLV